MKKDINDLDFNNLPKKERLELLKPTFHNPFTLTNVQKSCLTTINPFSMKLYGPWEDGIHTLHCVFRLAIYRKIQVKDGEVTRVWRVTKYNKFEEIKPYSDGTWDVDLFK